MRNALLMFALVASLAPRSLADHLSDFYVIPAATRTAGASGTFWGSDVSIHNFQPSPLTIEFLFIESGEGRSQNISNLESTALPNGSITIPAGGTLILRDVLDGFEGRRDGLLGALALSAQLPFAVISRIHTSAAAGGTYGQTVPPVQGFVDNTVGNTNNATAVAYIPGLVNNTGFRTNIGFVAASGNAGMTVTVELLMAAGNVGGSRTFVVPANTFVHLQFSAASMSTELFNAASARFRIPTGAGAVAPYVSVVDNVTGDAVFATGAFPPTTTMFKQSMEQSQFRRLVLQKLGR